MAGGDFHIIEYLSSMKSFYCLGGLAFYDYIAITHEIDREVMFKLITSVKGY